MWQPIQTYYKRNGREAKYKFLAVAKHKPMGKVDRITLKLTQETMEAMGWRVGNKVDFLIDPNRNSGMGMIKLTANGRYKLHGSGVKRKANINKIKPSTFSITIPNNLKGLVSHIDKIRECQVLSMAEDELIFLFPTNTNMEKK